MLKRKEVEEKLRLLNENLERQVTDRTKQLVEAHDELARKEKLAILGQLAGSVSHELRTPLGIMNNAVYFLKKILPEADEPVGEYLDMIKNEVDNSERIITDLLDFARTKPSRTATMPARELIDGRLRNIHVPNGVSFRIDIAEAAPMLRVDPQQMQQVLQNLITNGIQAMPGGGELTVWTEPKPEPGMLGISVADNGMGIPPESMKKLFQPLFTTKAKGIGLGLVVCKNLVEANGGSITVTSEPGKGTTFELILPTEVEASASGQ